MVKKPYVIQSIEYERKESTPLLELKRMELMKDLKEECAIILRPYSIDINNILPRWIMLQLSHSRFLKDAMFPYNGDDNLQLEKDLSFLSRRKINVAQVMNELNLSQRCNFCIDQLSHFDAPPVDFQVVKKGDFEQFSILQYSFQVHKQVIQKMKRLYSGKDFYTDVLCILLRYNTLESYNQQLAVHPAFYQYLHDTFHVDLELFGSPLNCFMTDYCSLFVDLEKSFQSRGNFNHVTIQRGFYVANPPYDEEIMWNMTVRILSFLQNSTLELSFVLILPVWEDPQYGVNKTNKKLFESPYCIHKIKIVKKKAKFFDYYKYKFIYPCDIYIVLMQNEQGQIKHKLDLAKVVGETYG